MDSNLSGRSDMTTVGGASLTVCACVLLLPSVTGLLSDDRVCAFSDLLQEAEPQSRQTNELHGLVQENGTIRCSHGSHCFGLWKKRADGKIQLVRQGCWPHTGNKEECHGDRCLVKFPPPQMQNGSYRFCCCSGDLCNTNFTEAPPTTLRLLKTENRQTVHQLALIALVTVAIAAALIIVFFLGYRIMRGKKKHTLSAVNVLKAANSDASVQLDNLKLMELIGRGRYGTVFCGSLNDRCVAVKLFNSSNRQNYANECLIYKLPLLQQHDNIACFLTANERTTTDGRPEFLIVMDFYPHGCLSHYLSIHTVDWSTCCRMTHGVTRGLSFLHTELYRRDQYKPAVAHRDLTSRNVLVRADLTCVVSDFGLSMTLTGSQPCCPGDDDTMTISEVGTIRYMAPEVLCGALNLRDCEAALKQVDVYALGLLYWESFSRCSHLFPGNAVPEYQQAFQAELGNHPSLEEMQILVVQERFRPRFPEAWKGNSLALRSLKETIEDCWDQDAEARLTAQCAEKRLSELILLSSTIYNHSSPLQVGCMPYTEALQVGVVKNFTGDSQSAMKTISGAAPVEKNGNIKQQQACPPTSDRIVLDSVANRPPNILCKISECEHRGNTLSSIPVHLQLTERDLVPNKLDPKEVDKNQTKDSEENLMEFSQKQIRSRTKETVNQLYHQMLHPAEGETVLTAAESHLVTTNNTSMSHDEVHSITSDGCNTTCITGTVVTNSVAGDQIKLAGLKLEEEDKLDRRMTRGDNNCVNSSLDEHEEYQPAESTSQFNHQSQRGSILAECGSNTNNNNNRTALGSDLKNQIFEVDTKRMAGSDVNPRWSKNSSIHESHLASQQISGCSVFVSDPESTTSGHIQTLESPPYDHDIFGGLYTGPCIQSTLCPELLLAPASTRDSNVHLVQSTTGALVSDYRGPDDGSALVSTAQTSTIQEQSCKTSSEFSITLDTQSLTQQVVASEKPIPQTSTMASQDPEITLLEEVSETAALQSQSLVSQISGLLQPQLGLAGAGRLERPCSLKLSSACISSENCSLSASGEKIKRRVKTPFALKKWRPATWVVSTDTNFDLEFSCRTSMENSQTHKSGSSDIPKIKPSKSSMAAFVAGGGTIETITPKYDGMTSF